MGRTTVYVPPLVIATTFGYAKLSRRLNEWDFNSTCANKFLATYCTNSNASLVKIK